MTRIFCAFTGVIVTVPTLALGGVEHFNADSAFMLLIGLLFTTAALITN
jgi:hypothetical protein